MPSYLPSPASELAPDLPILGIHHDLIKEAVHEPIRQAPHQIISRLPHHQLELPLWFTNATDAQRDALKEIHALNNLSLAAVNNY